MIIKVLFAIFPFCIFFASGLVENNTYFMIYCAFMIASTQVKNVELRTLLFYMCFMSAVWILIGMFNGDNIELSNNTLQTMNMFLLGVMIYLGVQNMNIDFTDVICTVAIVHSVIIIIEAFGIDTRWHPVYAMSKDDSYYNIGWMLNTNYAGAFLAICFPLFFRKKKFHISSLIVIAGIFCTKSLTAILALFISSAIMLNPWFLLFAIPICLGYSGFIDKHNLFNNSRVNDYWLPQIHAQTKFVSMFFGYGIQAVTAGKGHAHNEFITCFAKFGLLGIYFIMRYILDIYYKIKSNKASIGCLSAIIVSSIGIHTLHVPYIAFLILIILGGFETREEKYGDN